MINDVWLWEETVRTHSWQFRQGALSVFRRCKILHTSLNAEAGASLALFSVRSKNIGHDEAFIRNPE